MKWDIFHSTRYEYESAVRDSVNSICLQPMDIPEQTVDSFILKVLPASRLTHFQDLVSIGHGRDYSDVAPISGNYHGTRERNMTVTVIITAVI